MLPSRWRSGVAARWTIGTRGVIPGSPECVAAEVRWAHGAGGAADAEQRLPSRPRAGPALLARRVLQRPHYRGDLRIDIPNRDDP